MSKEYVFGQNDRLVITAYNSLASVVLSVQGSFVNDRGDEVPFAFALTPTTDRVATVASSVIGRGELKSLVVYASAGSPVRGQTYARVTKRYGEQATGLDTAVIVQGYIADGEFLNYPGGRNYGSTKSPGVIRSITGSTPALAAEISETVPTGALWRPLAMRALLTTGATGANRQVSITLSDGTTVYARSLHSDLQDNVRAWYYNFFIGADTVDVEGDSDLTGPFPPVIMPAGHIIATLVDSLQNDDQWDAPQLLVEEWLQP